MSFTDIRTAVDNTELQVTSDAASLAQQRDAERARADELQRQLDALTEPQGTLFGIDISDLGPDGSIPEKTKYDNHKALLQPDVPVAERSAGVTRVFLKMATLGPAAWNDERLQALTANDIPHISFWNNLRDPAQRAGLRAMLDATPEKFSGQALFGCGHEIERNLYDTGNFNQALGNWLTDNQILAEELDTSPIYSPDDVVKTLLFYSQHVDPALKGTWELFYGDQNFGMLGMDCYHLQSLLNRMTNGQPSGAYTAPDVLFKYVLEMQATGLPVCLPEWGGTLANTDPTGTGRAAAIRDGGAFLETHGVAHASWWDATGSKDPSGQFRNHHLEQVGGATSPEVAAYRELTNS